MPRPRNPHGILNEIRSAFDGESVPMKNVALRYASDCIEDLLDELKRAKYEVSRSSVHD